MNSIDHYRQIEGQYKDFTQKMHALIVDILNEHNIKYSAVEHRTKSVDSFSEKVNRSGKTYNDPINEITDLSGLRIILYYMDDLYRVRSIIESEFDVDKANSRDNRDGLEFDQFGYLSIHEIVTLKSTRSSLPEWRRLTNYKAEIQIRTVLQHAWASISHTLQYKNENDVPKELRRQLHRLSGLFELADEQFLMIKESRESIVADVNNSIEENVYTDVQINLDSVDTYATNSQNAKEIMKIIDESAFKTYAVIGGSESSQLVNICKLFDIKTIEQLDNILSMSMNKFGQYLRDFIVNYNIKYEVSGSIQHIITVLLVIMYGKMEDFNKVKEIVLWGDKYINAALKTS